MTRAGNSVREYLASIGGKGGSKSRRVLTSEQARNMVKARERKKRKAAKSNMMHRWEGQ
jgi:hypothetical protein